MPNDDTEKCDCSDFEKNGFDLNVEQTRDDDISEIRSSILNGQESKDVQKHYLIVDDLHVVFYVSNVNDDPCLRLFIPKHLRIFVKQYPDQNGHISVQKTFDSKRQKYYWPNMSNGINTYVSECVVCQTRSLQKFKQPQQETDIPRYPMAKLSIDVLGPYPTTLSGNKIIIAFADCYSCWPEVFAVSDKIGETVASLIIDQIFPIFGSSLQIVTDNSTGNVNKVVNETLAR